MKLNLSRVLWGIFVFLLVPMHLRADAVYTLAADSSANFIVNWTFDVPSLLIGTNTITVPESSITSQSVGGLFASDGCSVTEIFVEPFNANFNPPAGILTTHLDCTGPVSSYGYVLSSDTSFLSFGTYSLSQGATLNITQTPEPSILLLLTVGLIATLAMAIGRHQQFHDIVEFLPARTLHTRVH
jgi:hypothetical protein